MAEEIGAVGNLLQPTLLADFLHTGAQAAGDTYDFTAKKLESDEVAEIEYIEIFSPIGAWPGEDLLHVVPVIDGHRIEEYVSLSGRYTSNMAPPRLHQMSGPSPLQSNRIVFSFGTPGVEDPFLNTTLKAKKSISIRTRAGDNGITQNYRIRVWGRLYKGEAMLRSVFGDRVYGAEATIEDRNRGKSLSVTKDAVDVSIKNWDTFVGGMKQSKPEIMPMVRYAYNAVATTANSPFDFNYSDGDVANDWEDMYFDFGTSEALFVKGIGVRSQTHLKYMGLKIGDREYPRCAGDEKLFRVDYNNNPLHFGHGYPLFPQDFPLFVPMPLLPMGYLIHNEKGRVIVYDDGTSVPADDGNIPTAGIIACLQGIKVNLP